MAINTKELYNLPEEELVKALHELRTSSEEVKLNDAEKLYLIMNYITSVMFNKQSKEVGITGPALEAGEYMVQIFKNLVFAELVKLDNQYKYLEKIKTSREYFAEALRYMELYDKGSNDFLAARCDTVVRSNALFSMSKLLAEFNRDMDDVAPLDEAVQVILPKKWQRDLIRCKYLLIQSLKAKKSKSFERAWILFYDALSVLPKGELQNSMIMSISGQYLPNPEKCIEIISQKIDFL